MFSFLMYVPPSIDKITDNIYLGNEAASRDKKLLKDRGVTHVLVSAKFLAKHHPEDFEYCELPLDDFITQDLFPYIYEAVEFIKSSKVVYVHCAAGVSRSSSMVIAYLMIEKNMTFEEAYLFVRKRRSIISPNPGFVGQLKKLDALIHKKDFDLKKLAKMKV